MVSTCVCTGCPGKKNKTATSKECVWYNKFVDVNNKEIPDMLQLFAAKYSPKGHLDLADLLLKSLATRGTMLLVDATTILENNQQRDENQNDVENGNANNLARSLVDEIASGVESTCDSHVANLHTEIPKQTHNEFFTR
eukprot:4222237-Ditylum_brightwellii.AAC.1